MYVCNYTCMYVCMRACLCACMLVCMYACMPSIFLRFSSNFTAQTCNYEELTPIKCASVERETPNNCVNMAKPLSDSRQLGAHMHTYIDTLYYLCMSKYSNRYRHVNTHIKAHTKVYIYMYMAIHDTIAHCA